MNKLVLNVEGMSCSHCEKSVKKAVFEIDGVSDVKVSLADRQVTVEHNGNVPDSSIKDAIEEVGYDVI